MTRSLLVLAGIGLWSHIALPTSALSLPCWIVEPEKEQRLREAAVTDALAHKAWPEGNLLLARVTDDARDWLRPWLEPFEARSGDIPIHAGHTITHLYFPVDSAIAKVSVDRQGDTAESVLIGNEGVLGLNALLGDGRAAGHAIVQIPGRCYRIGAAPLREAFEESAVLRRTMLRYVSFRVQQTSQSNLCITRHTLEQRVARWLLQAADHAGHGELRITHELIGVALGVRREAVTITALRLQAAGAIACARRRITVRSRAALEAASCECYAALKAEVQQMARDIRQR
jgi:CRP-like cAMP-binding protein